MEEMTRFGSDLDEIARKLHLQGKARVDHICFKCESSEVYNQVWSLLRRHSIYLYESTLAERQVGYIHLRAGKPTVLGVIDHLELSDVKPGKTQKSHCHHIEIMPAGTTSYDDLVEIFRTAGKKIEVNDAPHHKTHDVLLQDDFRIRLTRAPLLDKIKEEEMH